VKLKRLKTSQMVDAVPVLPASDGETLLLCMFGDLIRSSGEYSSEAVTGIPPSPYKMHPVLRDLM